MKTFFAIYSTDQINKYNHRITVSALEDGVWQQGVYGMPTHLGHDLHKPTGWSIPFGLYFEPGITYVVGRTLIAENTKDSDHIISAQRNHLMNSYAESINPFKEEFIKLLDTHFSEDGYFHYPSCVSFIKNNILFDVFPSLKALMTKEKNGLIYLDELLQEFDYLSQGIFKHKKSNYAIFAHQFFRRSLSRLNNYHFIFLDELLELASDSNVRVRISLDPDMVGFAPSVLKSFEYEYWWGGKYNDDISQIKPDSAWHNADEFERLYYGIDRTEFNWKHDGSNYEFELEEVRNDSTPGLEQDYGCRYVHSIYDKNAKTFHHFDGAIRSYDPELMIERIGLKMVEFGRRSKYTKIFRVDGKLPIAKWKSLVTNYLQSNPLIYEYFGLEKPEIKKIIENNTKTIREKLVPYSINKNEGIRILVSYHEKQKEQSNPRFISIFDAFDFDDETHRAIEFDIIELKKALNRIGTDLYIPNNIHYILAEDLYCNIPCIFHSDDNSQVLLDQTLSALRNIFDSLVKSGHEKVFSFTLAWNMESQQARISIFGHVIDLQKWIHSIKQIPVERNQFKIWLEEQALFLSKITTSHKNPDLAEVIQYDGVLYVKRRSVNTDVNINYKNSNRGLEFEMKFDATQSDLLNAIKIKEVYPIGASIVQEITCAKDGLNYLDSPYSTFLDADAGQVVKKFLPIGLFWSDKPA